MPALEEFSIGGSTHITPAGLLRLAEAPALKKVVIGKMKNIAPGAIDELRSRKPALEIILK
jgi:hypothetical protein